MNIRIGENAKKGLDRLKKTGGYSTLTSCLEDIVWFFERNQITPKDLINQELNHHLYQNRMKEKKEIEDLKEFIKKDSLSLRKRFGAIERDYFKKFESKIDSVYEVVHKIPDEELEGYFRDMDWLLTSRTSTIETLNKELEASQLKINEYHRCLKALNKAVRMEKTTTGHRLYLNMQREEAEPLFHLIPDLN